MMLGISSGTALGGLSGEGMSVEEDVSKEEGLSGGGEGVKGEEVVSIYGSPGGGGIPGLMKQNKVNTIRVIKSLNISSVY